MLSNRISRFTQRRFEVHNDLAMASRHHDCHGKSSHHDLQYNLIQYVARRRFEVHNDLATSRFATRAKKPSRGPRAPLTNLKLGNVKDPPPPPCTAKTGVVVVGCSATAVALRLPLSLRRSWPPAQPISPPASEPRRLPLANANVANSTRVGPRYRWPKSRWLMYRA